MKYSLSPKNLPPSSAHEVDPQTLKVTRGDLRAYEARIKAVHSELEALADKHIDLLDKVYRLRHDFTDLIGDGGANE